MVDENNIQEQIQSLNSSGQGPHVEEQQEHTEQQEVQQEVPQAAAQPQVDERERNFAALREAREKAERERDEAINYIRQMQQQAAPAQEEEEAYAPDDLVEWKQVQKKFNKLEQKLTQYEQQTALQMTETRIKAQLSDFDQVVTRENVEALRIAYPEIAQSLHASPDIYSKAVSTYNIIKQFGIGQQQPIREYEKQTIQRNMAKPRATNSVSPQQGESPLNKANDFASGNLTEERKAQLFREMQQARNNW